MAFDAGSAQGSLEIDVGQFLSAMQAVEASLGRIADAAESGFSKTSEEGEKTTKKVNDFEDALKAAAEAMAAFATAKAFAGFLVDSAAAFAEAEGAATRLNVALSNMSLDGASAELSAFASEMQRTAGIDADATKQLEAQLIAQGRTVDETMKILQAGMALSATTGEDLNSVVQQLSMSLTGTAGRLARVVPGLKDMTAEQLKAGGAIAFVNEKYGAFLGNTGTTEIAMKRAEAAFGDFQELVGEAVSPTVIMVSDAFSSLTEALTTLSGPAKEFFGVIAIAALGVLTGMAARTAAVALAKWGLFGAQMAVNAANAVGNPLLWVGIAAAIATVAAVTALVVAKNREAEAYAKSTAGIRDGSKALDENSTLAERYTAELIAMSSTELELERKRLQARADAARSEEERAALLERVGQVDKENAARAYNAEQERKAQAAAARRDEELAVIARYEAAGGYTAEEAAAERARVMGEAQLATDESRYDVLQKVVAEEQRKKALMDRLKSAADAYVASLQNMSLAELNAAKAALQAEMARATGMDALTIAQKRLDALDAAIKKVNAENWTKTADSVRESVTATIEGARSETEKLQDEIAKLNSVSFGAGTADELARIEAIRIKTAELAALEEKKAKDIATRARERRTAEAALTATRVDDLEAQLADELAQWEGNEAMRAAIAEKYAKDIEAARDEETKAAIDGANKALAAAKERAAGEKTLTAQIADSWSDYWKDMKEKSKLTMDGVKDAAGEVTTLLTRDLSKITAQYFANENSALDVQYGEQYKKLEELREAQLVTDEEYEARKTELEKEEKAKRNELKKKEFEADKVNSIAGVWIDAAKSIAGYWAVAPELGPFAGPIFGGVMTAAALGMAGAQTSLIAGQVFVPEYATGGTAAGVSRINERGGEIVNLPDGTVVIPNDISRRIAEASSPTSSPSIVVSFDGARIDESVNLDVLAAKVSKKIAEKTRSRA